jgi:CBS domain-containing protein
MSVIRDVMSKDFKFITPDASVQDAAAQMRDGDFGFLPVGENDRLVGMVTDRDIAVRACAEGKAADFTQIRDVRTAKTYYCFDDQTVYEVCDNMADVKVRRMPVVNSDKRLVGIVSLGDVAKACHGAKCGDALQDIRNNGQISEAA